MPKVKLCGFRKQSDVDVACKFGADFLGFVFCDESPRYIAFGDFAKLDLSNIGRTKTVAVFRDADEDKINAVVRSNKVDYIQIHDCDYNTAMEFAKLRPLIHAFSGTDFTAEELAKYNFCDYFLFDNVLAGSGQERDFSFASTISDITKKAFFLAGGINIRNYQGALQYTDMIDISSGIESTRGEKNSDMIKDLLITIHNENTY